MHIQHIRGGPDFCSWRAHVKNAKLYIHKCMHIQHTRGGPDFVHSVLISKMLRIAYIDTYIQKR